MTVWSDAQGSFTAQHRDQVLLMVLTPALGVVAAAIFALWRGGVSGVAITLFFVFYIMSGIGVEIGFHRYFSHRAFKCSPRLRLVLGMLGSMAGQGPVLFWAIVHRQHHHFSDTPLDPHTPHAGGLRGFWRAHIGWMFAVSPLDFSAYGADLVRDAVTVQVHRLYLVCHALGLGVPALIGGLYAGLPGAVEGLLWGGFVRIFVNHHVTWSINSLCHLWGSSPNATKDQSRNLWPLALPSLGGAWHNNHHACPASAINTFRWWQLDPGAWIIRGAEALGLVWDVKVPPRRVLDSGGAP
jgi:stearoyl-CoA desaturase (Delta-9 desaturase)